MKHTPEKLKAKIDAYFESISYETPVMHKRIGGFTNGKGKPMYYMKEAYDAEGNPLMQTEWVRPPTISGLCLYLGMPRTYFYEIEQKAEYKEMCEMARLRIEAYLEEQLCTRDMVSGIVKDLERRHGWDKPEESAQSGDAPMSMAERKAFLLEAIDEIKEICK